MPLCRRLGRERQSPTLGRVTQGVGREVLQRLLEALRIGADRQFRRLHDHLERDPPLADRRPVPVGDSSEQLLDRNILNRERAAASFEPREIEQIADQRLELLRFLADDSEVAAAASAASSLSSGIASVSV